MFLAILDGSYYQKSQRWLPRWPTKWKLINATKFGSIWLHVSANESREILQSFTFADYSCPTGAATRFLCVLRWRPRSERIGRGTSWQEPEVAEAHARAVPLDLHTCRALETLCTLSILQATEVRPSSLAAPRQMSKTVHQPNTASPPVKPTTLHVKNVPLTQSIVMDKLRRQDSRGKNPIIDVLGNWQRMRKSDQ